MLVKIDHYSKNALANPGFRLAVLANCRAFCLAALVNSCFFKFNLYTMFYLAAFCVFATF